MQISTAGNSPSTRGAAEYFTGAVRVDMLYTATAPGRSSAGLVTFEPGARTAWHTHPLGQAILIVSGMGWVQKQGGRVQEVRAGDTVWFDAGEKHWHGATPTNGMSHIAITESLDGKVADWLEQVTDEQYRKV